MKICIQPSYGRLDNIQRFSNVSVISFDLTLDSQFRTDVGAPLRWVRSAVSKRHTLHQTKHTHKKTKTLTYSGFFLFFLSFVFLPLLVAGTHTHKTRSKGIRQVWSPTIPRISQKEPYRNHNTTSHALFWIRWS